MYKYESHNPMVTQAEYIRKVVELLKKEKSVLELIGHKTFHEEGLEPEIDIDTVLNQVKAKQRICDIELELIAKQSMLDLLTEKIATDAKELTEEYDDAIAHYPRVKEIALDFTKDAKGPAVFFSLRIEYALKVCEHTLSIDDKAAFMFFFVTLCVELHNATGKAVI